MNLPWSTLAPQTDFYGAYMRPQVDRQALQQAMLRNQQMQTQNQFLGPQLQENLVASQMQNQTSRELMPYNIPMAEQELTNKRLNGQLSELDLELKPKEFQMRQQEMGLRQQQAAMQAAVQQMQMRKYQAEIEQMQNPAQFNPLTDVKGPAQQIATADWYDEEASIIEESGDLETAKKMRENANAIRNSVPGSAKFSSLTADDKRAITARGRGLGLSEFESINAEQQGIPLEEVARSKGWTEEEIGAATSIHNTTLPSLTQIQKQLRSEAEGEYLDTFITNSMSRYANEFDVFGNFSQKQIGDLVSNFVSGKEHSPEEFDHLVDFLSASLMIPEGVTIRANQLLGSNIGIESLKYLQESYPYVKQGYSNIENPEVRKAVADRVSEITKNTSSIGIMAIQDLPNSIKDMAKTAKEAKLELKTWKKENSYRNPENNFKSSLNDYSDEELDGMSTKELEDLQIHFSGGQ